MSAPQYIFEASSKPSLPLHKVPLVRATEQSLKGYGCFVDDPDSFEIEITRWPAQGWRPIDEGTGDEAGWVEGIFRCNWKGDVLYGENEAVNGEYVLGWSTDPQKAQTETAPSAREHVLLWHMNYHPDGGQFFYPLENKPFIVPLALPGDSLTPERVVAFWCEGDRGIYIHPNIWHEGVFPVADTQRFQDRQGRVHARVSADIGKEFGVYLACPLTPGKIKEL
ncbi:ureidoglycolate hydrolase [Marinosulfonomonas sp. PRT-SC04]|nr:ureidoglycolate hydrolase [Marinosulfonomonas sp. PRT-SC04]